MRLPFVLALSALVAIDLLIAVTGSLYAGRAAVVVVILFFATAVALVKRWDGALFALHTPAILGLLLRGVIAPGGAVIPSLPRSLVLLLVVDGLVFVVTRLRA